eukprot:TRINITY_DN7567_c0_g1_i1.p2 TRINITY_DN7567_c0_g1~~TRINITY_DN7567_c0_g1_i1.p2  ORF type:complete len:247 (-),score=29.84 TRINITY_DN7567_c0_g1_i1:238-978(-)
MPPPPGDGDLRQPAPGQHAQRRPRQRNQPNPNPNPPPPPPRDPGYPSPAVSVGFPPSGAFSSLPGGAPSALGQTPEASAHARSHPRSLPTVAPPPDSLSGSGHAPSSSPEGTWWEHGADPAALYGQYPQSYPLAPPTSTSGFIPQSGPPGPFRLEPPYGQPVPHGSATLAPLPPTNETDSAAAASGPVQVAEAAGYYFSPDGAAQRYALHMGAAFSPSVATASVPAYASAAPFPYSDSPYAPASLH